MSHITEQELEDMEALFVQTAASTTSDRRRSRYGACRRRRCTSRTGRSARSGTCRLVSSSTSGGLAQQLADNPPNAVLSFAEPDDKLPEDAVVVIQDPRLDGDMLTYSITLLDGTVPATTGPCALFIDPFGRPLSPVSAAGMHRRERRRR